MIEEDLALSPGIRAFQIGRFHRISEVALNGLSPDSAIGPGFKSEECPSPANTRHQFLAVAEGFPGCFSASQNTPQDIASCQLPGNCPFRPRPHWNTVTAFERVNPVQPMKAKIIITPKKAVLDPQGKTVQNALEHMGHAGVTGVHVGKYLEIDLAPGTDRAAAEKSLHEACRRFLSNPVIEDYRLEVVD
jgi:phosphoribosylformylglycinamidine synthase